MDGLLDASFHYSHELNETTCDNIHNVGRTPLYGFEIQFLVLEEKMLQVLARTNDAHKFVQYLMRRYWLEDNHRGMVEMIYSADLCIIK